MKSPISGPRGKLAAAALLGAGAAAVLAGRERLRTLRRSDEDLSSPAQEESVYSSLGVASTGETAPEGRADADGAPDSASSSETPGTTAPPL